MTLYPVFLDLAGRDVIVVGGGTVAASKLAGLVEARANITVVAPAICDAIRASDARLVEREFSTTDLDGAAWVVAAATPAVNAAVAAAATARGLFVNAVDDKAAATAFLGGVVRRGDIAIAISTGGAAPALAGLLREALDALLPAEELERALELAIALRAEWKAQNLPIAARREALRKVLEAA